jgi:hypothetical protein
MAAGYPELPTAHGFLFQHHKEFAADLGTFFGDAAWPA